MTNRTSAYRFTVQMKDGKPVGKDADLVQGLRTVVKLGNSAFSTQQYVKLQGRGPRKVNGRKYFQSLPLQYATHADVYVYNR
jgi:hypothetical protein